jgi:acyl-CoA synthetase (AMP-forming)/AMP-acid ligase II
VSLTAAMSNKIYISDCFQKSARKQADEDFLICNDRTLSWSEVYKLSNSIAGFVSKKLEQKQQKIVGILLPDSWQFVIAYFGIVESGNIALPLDITFKKLELDFVINAAEPEFVIVNQQTRHLIDGPAVLIEDILRTEKGSYKPKYQLPPDKQIATLFFSSGTTGQPKPIPNTHRNQLWDVTAISEPMGWTDKDRLLITLHLAHRHGLVICLLGAVLHGNTVYLEERFSAERTLQMLETGKVTLYSSVPAAYVQLVEYMLGHKFDLSSVRLFASSSSILSPALQQAFKARFGHDILDRYGTSETGSIAIRSGSGDDGFGKLLEGVQIRLQKNGEVAMKSPGLFPGYYKNKPATKANMTADGWWLTGDIAEMQGDKLILKGRTKEKISKGGYSIFPQDIEWALTHHGDIGEVKVIGLVDISKKTNPEDRIVAFITGPAEVKTLQTYAAENLPRSWRPDDYIKIDKIPKTANGKPKIQELKHKAEQMLNV